MPVRSALSLEAESGTFLVPIEPERLQRPFSIQTDRRLIVTGASAAIRRRIPHVSGRLIDELLRCPVEEGWTAFLEGNRGETVSTALIVGDKQQEVRSA